MSQLSRRGHSTRLSSGTMSRATQPVVEALPPVMSSGTAGIPTMSPQMAASATVTKATTAERRRGMCSRAPISAWATMLQTAPGRYLPS